ncbi:biogenesis of lysosome-related organelles complex 1 subunit 6-like isoform X1 [Littorina saxatilis]|uniref:Biogenesis of lysosome-related organelles complex 1 subunit 6 n=1 Tax=Littorina saxatilis TaxID=31220 RepID=A0AAN9B0N8_9CAEN
MSATEERSQGTDNPADESNGDQDNLQQQSSEVKNEGDCSQKEDAGSVYDLEPSDDTGFQNEGDCSQKEDAGSVYDLEPSDDTGFRMGEEETVDPAIVQKLSNGFMENFMPSLEKSKSSITEILSSQTVLIDTLEQENAKFSECTAHAQLSDMMMKAKNYHNKLLSVKRDMTNLHDKAAKLKRRALKLQQQKQKEELQRAHQQERELEKEQMLTARVARPDS